MCIRDRDHPKALEYKLIIRKKLEFLVDLIDFDQIYADVFAYVFGETLVFSALDSARAQLGLNRLVTLDGELLEKSGAMTGGSFLGRGVGLSFGRSNEVDELELNRLEADKKILNRDLVKDPQIDLDTKQDQWNFENSIQL